MVNVYHPRATLPSDGKRLPPEGNVAYERANLEVLERCPEMVNVYHWRATFTIGGERCPGMVQATRLKEIYSRIIILMSHAKR